MTTDLPTLLNLCANAATDHRLNQDQQAIDDAATDMKFAIGAAESAFGAEAAATLTGWTYTDNPPADTLQMFTPLADGVYLRYTAPMEDHDYLEVVANCDSCGHVRDTRVASLTALGKALASAGVR